MTFCSPWTTEADLVDCNCDFGNLGPEKIATLLSAASEWLYRNSGEQFGGVCSVVERPCGCSCGCGSPYRLAVDVTGWSSYGSAYPGSGCCDASLCGCSTEQAIGLTYGPIVGDPAVVIDGVAFTDFVVAAPNLLVRTDGGSWPSCQSYVTGWTVTYDFGTPAPALGVVAAQALTIELVKACSDRSGDCALPTNVVNLVRRGVSYNLDPEQTGKAIPEVGLFISAYGRKGKADIRIPGRRRGYVTTGPLGS